MTMDPMMPPADAVPAGDAAKAQEPQAGAMDVKREAMAAAALVELFQMWPDCVSFSAKQADDGSVALACEMKDGSKAEYAVSAAAVDAAIAESASED